MSGLKVTTSFFYFEISFFLFHCDHGNKSRKFVNQTTEKLLAIIFLSNLNFWGFCADFFIRCKISFLNIFFSSAFCKNKFSSLENIKCTKAHFYPSFLFSIKNSLDISIVSKATQIPISIIHKIDTKIPSNKFQTIK